MILEPLGGFEHVKSGFIRKPYDFTTKASLPYIKTKRARNIPDIHYDENNMAKRVVEQIATDIYSNQVKENFETIGFIPKVKALSVNINFTSKQKNEPIKEGFSSKTITAKQVFSTPFFTPSNPPKTFTAPAKKSPTRKGFTSDSDESSSSPSPNSYRLALASKDDATKRLVKIARKITKTESSATQTQTAEPRRSVRIESKKND